MRIPILEPTNDRDIFLHSSTSQHKNKLSVFAGGEWLPISYDELLYIDCDIIKSRRCIVTDGDDIGYNYPVGECKFYTDEYVYHDEKGTELRALPHWFGEGFYKANVNSNSFVNADNGALGTHNEYNLRVGLSYARARETLKGVE